MGDKLQAVGDKVSGVGETLTKSVAVPLAGIGAAAVATAANFESSMSTVNGESVNTMDTLSALGMGTDEAVTMVDQRAKTSSTTNTSVDQLGDAILTIGATAKSVKGSTAELNTLIGWAVRRMKRPLW